MTNLQKLEKFLVKEEIPFEHFCPTEGFGMVEYSKVEGDCQMWANIFYDANGRVLEALSSNIAQHNGYTQFSLKHTDNVIDYIEALDAALDELIEESEKPQKDPYDEFGVNPSDFF